MNFCDADGCAKLASQKCSACKYTYYCTETCQKESWKTHKKGCKIQQKLNEMTENFKAAEAKKPVKKPRRTHCTGCNVKFGDDGYEDYIDDECPDCGYMACESCSCHDRRGSCYCDNTNFGRPYCVMNPRWYHMSSRSGKVYRGDRHPPEVICDDPNEYEKEPRACGNCGKTERCLKAEYL